MDELAQRRLHRQDPSAEPLWREVLGARLRRLRKIAGQTLTGLAERAGVSPQYLSEVERGRKEPSSEMIAAISGALGLTLVELTSHVADELRRTSFTSSLPSHHLVAPQGPGQTLTTGVQLSLVA